MKDDPIAEEIYRKHYEIELSISEFEEELDKMVLAPVRALQYADYIRILKNICKCVDVMLLSDLDF